MCARGAQNFLALVPLALLLGEVTEDLALRFGDTIGGLLNATFGNVVELILSVAALRARLYDVVATSLVGSVLSNLLLVLGAPPVRCITTSLHDLQKQMVSDQQSCCGSRRCRACRTVQSLSVRAVPPVSMRTNLGRSCVARQAFPQAAPRQAHRPDSGQQY